MLDAIALPYTMGIHIVQPEQIMATSYPLPSGIIVDCPDGLELNRAVREPRQGPLFAAPAEGKGGEEPVFMAVARVFEVLDKLEFQPKSPKLGFAAKRKTEVPEPLAFRVPLLKGQSALILSECEGVLRWEYPDAVEEEADVSVGLGAAASPCRRVAVFKETYQPSKPPESPPESLGFSPQDFVDWALAPMKKWVLRFVARQTAEAVTDFLERDVRETPLLLQRNDDGSYRWEACPDFRSVTARNKRVLLFVHGTFSSSGGSFGGMLVSAEGRRFLARASSHYDAVIAYDHKTLARSVKENAEDLRDKLATLPAEGIEIDAVAFSRGGLVLRWLTDVLFPGQPGRIKLNKAVFVACTNNGTLLAESRYWKDWANLYINLVVGSARLVGILGGPGIAATAQTLVQYLASETLDGNAVPGLASMQPNGEVVRTLKDRTPPRDARFFAVEADFDHSFFSGGKLQNIGLAKRLFLEGADAFIDQLFKNAPNDLVVDQTSMSRLESSAILTGKHIFKPGDGVYHTVYFDNPMVVGKLDDWLK